jgi:hypothetical protein
MKCYNPLYRLFDALNGTVDTNDLIAECEGQTTPNQFANDLASKARSGIYDTPKRPANALEVFNAGLMFACWWSMNNA